MDEFDSSCERSTADIVLFALAFVAAILATTGVILSSPGLAFTAGILSFLCVLPFAMRGAT